MTGSAEPPADLRAVLCGPVLAAAARLLGSVIRHGPVAVRLTEVEAYAGSDDPGSHAYRGRTARTEVMFGPPGRLYVYFTYGMHHCANVVCGPPGTASAVLVRAGEVMAGVEEARRRRGHPARDRDLARGPARLCQALGLDRTHNGADLLAGADAESSVRLVLGEPVAPVRRGPRVGLRDAADRPWRLWIPGEPSVSPYRPAAPLRRPPGAEG